jgi:hypothetical protein
MVTDAAGRRWVTVPDFTLPSNYYGEVKTWELVHISSQRTAEQMLRNLGLQVEKRTLIPGSRGQVLVFDVRGQFLPVRTLKTVGEVASEASGLAPKNVVFLDYGASTGGIQHWLHPPRLR